MTDAVQRLRTARDRTIAAGSARIWTASFDDGADGQTPDFESTGVVDFLKRSAWLEARASEAQADRLYEMVSSLPSSGEGFSLDAAREWSQVSVFVGDQEFSCAGSKQHWVGGEADWWDLPLLSLDLLSAVSDASEGCKSDIRGREATECAGTVLRQDLARIDVELARYLLGRRGRQKLIVRAWVDSDDHVVRIWRAITPKRNDEKLTWATTEFWDFGIETNIEAPPKELVQPPATLRQIARDLWRIRRETNA